MPYRLPGMPVSTHTAVLLLMVFGLVTYPGLVGMALKSVDVQIFSVLIVLCGLSVIVNADNTHWFGLAGYFLSFLAFLVVRTIFLARHLVSLTNLLYVFLFLSGVISILQSLFGTEFYLANHLFRDDYYYPPYAVGLGLSSPNVMGMFMLWALGVLVCNLAIKSGHHKFAWIPYTTLMVGASGIYFTMSRSVWLGLGFLLVALLVSLWVNGRPLQTFRRILLMVFLSFLFCNLLPTRTDNVEREKFSWDGLNHRSVQARLYLWRITGVAVQQQGLWGSGVGQFEAYFDKAYEGLDMPARKHLSAWPNSQPSNTLVGPHNSIFEFFIDFGTLPTVVAFLLILIIIVTGVRRGIDNPSYIFSLALVGVIFAMQFNDMSKERLLWIGLGIIASLARPSPSPSPSPFRQDENTVVVTAEERSSVEIPVLQLTTKSRNI